jgi:hypothetical protein
MDNETNDFFGKLIAQMLMSGMIQQAEEMMKRDKSIIISLGSNTPITLYEFVTIAYEGKLIPVEAIEVVRQLEVGEKTVVSEMGDMEVTRVS